MTGIETADHCPRCGALVWWRLSVLGSRLRLDATPDPTGNVIIIGTPDGKVRADVLTGDRMPAQQEAWKQHACPKAKPGPPCAVCRRPMNPADLFRALRWTTHPGIGCDSEYQAEVARLAVETKRAARELRRSA
jgi:hypothetical protein